MVRLLMSELHEQECSQDKAKAQMELKFSRKARIRRFYVYIGRRKGKDSMDPQWVQGPSDKLQGKRCDSQLRFHM